jgi:hypothetical protein
MPAEMEEEDLTTPQRFGLWSRHRAQYPLG